MGENGATVVQSGPNGNSVVGRYSAFETNGGSVISNSYVIVSTTSGLRMWDLNSGQETDSTTLEERILCPWDSNYNSKM